MRIQATARELRAMLSKMTDNTVLTIVTDKPSDAMALGAVETETADTDDDDAEQPPKRARRIRETETADNRRNGRTESTGYVAVGRWDKRTIATKISGNNNHLAAAYILAHPGASTHQIADAMINSPADSRYKAAQSAIYALRAENLIKSVPLGENPRAVDRRRASGKRAAKR